MFMPKRVRLLAVNVALVLGVTAYTSFETPGSWVWHRE